MRQVSPAYLASHNVDRPFPVVALQFDKQNNPPVHYSARRAPRVRNLPRRTFSPEIHRCGLLRLHRRRTLRAQSPIPI